jgi:hypothetical protein
VDVDVDVDADADVDVVVDVVVVALVVALLRPVRAFGAALVPLPVVFLLVIFLVISTSRPYPGGIAGPFRVGSMSPTKPSCAGGRAAAAWRARATGE